MPRPPRRAVSALGSIASRRLVLAIAMTVMGTAMLLSSPAVAQPGPRSPPTVLRVVIDDTITPVISGYVTGALDRAERDGYDALVVSIDTPGGLDRSMRDIIKAFLAAEVPVIAYVEPRGGRAASAGAFVGMAAHVLAMAPSTVIGAATPVSLEGDDLDAKVVNDATALAESVALARGRDVEFARDMVRDGRSVTNDEAVEIGAADVTATTLDEVLAWADGRTVALGDGREVRVRTAGAVVDEAELGLLGRIQQALADPTLAFMFLSLGTLAIIYELANPGLGAGAVVGIACTLLALFGLAVLPVNVVGLLFLAAAGGLFTAELFAPGVGVAAVSGAVCLLLAGVFLIRDVPGMAVNLWVVAPTAAVVGVGTVVAGRLAARSVRAQVTLSGPGLFVGRRVTVHGAEGAAGQTFVEGAWWRLRSDGAPLRDGTEAEVVDMNGLELVVRPIPETGTPTNEPPTGSPPVGENGGRNE